MFGGTTVKSTAFTEQFIQTESATWAFAVHGQGGIMLLKSRHLLHESRLGRPSSTLSCARRRTNTVRRYAAGEFEKFNIFLIADGFHLVIGASSIILNEG